MNKTNNLPAQLTEQSLVSYTGKHHSLVARGMQALSKENDDAIYLQARETYNKLTDSGACWSGYEERSAPLNKAFETFLELAAKGYEKAFFPLSTLYSGDQSIKGDAVQSERYYRLALHWLHVNEHLNDVEIWHDLGMLYLGKKNEIAVRYFQKGADAEDPSCMWRLSGAYEFGDGVEEDWNQSRYWQIKAAMGGILDAQRGLECQHDHGDLDIDDDQVFEWYIWSAEQGYVWAQVCLADAFSYGNEIDLDEEQAAYWYEKAAIQGDSHAQLKLGEIYWVGSSYIESDSEQARYWLEKSVDENEPEAQYQFGLFLFEQGDEDQAITLIGCASDQNHGPSQYLVADDKNLHFDISDSDRELLFRMAFSWYEERLEFGDIGLKYDYAMMHLHHGISSDGMSLLREVAVDDSISVDRHHSACYFQRCACLILAMRIIYDDPGNAVEAIHWLSKAADLRSVTACTELAELYLYGYAGYAGYEKYNLVEIDQKLAVYWYERGIELDWRSVSFTLCKHYLEGKHLPKNLELAEKWLSQSAKKGYNPAQFLLGMEYASGIRLHQDSNAAIYWLSKATESGSKAHIELAKIYFGGKITSRDFDKAMNWLSRLRDKKDFRWNDAMKLIAEKCFDGRFNTKQETTAQEWIEETAFMLQKRVSDTDDHMYMCRAYYLAELYELGLGVEKNIEKAIYWYSQSGSARAKDRLLELEKK